MGQVRSLVPYLSCQTSFPVFPFHVTLSLSVLRSPVLRISDFGANAMHRPTQRGTTPISKKRKWIFVYRSNADLVLSSCTAPHNHLKWVKDAKDVEAQGTVTEGGVFVMVSIFKKIA